MSSIQERKNISNMNENALSRANTNKVKLNGAKDYFFKHSKYK